MKLPDIEECADLKHAEKCVREFILDEAMRGEPFEVDGFMNLNALRASAENRIKGLMRVIETCDALMKLARVSTSAIPEKK